MFTKQNYRKVGQALLAVIGCLLFASIVVACPTCKDGIAGNDPDSANLVRGYGWSIVFMMSMPFLIFSGLSAYFYWEVRKARNTAAKLGAQIPPGEEQRLGLSGR